MIEDLRDAGNWASGAEAHETGLGQPPAEYYLEKARLMANAQGHRRDQVTALNLDIADIKIMLRRIIELLEELNMAQAVKDERTRLSEACQNVQDD